MGVDAPTKEQLEEQRYSLMQNVLWAGRNDLDIYTKRLSSGAKIPKSTEFPPSANGHIGEVWISHARQGPSPANFPAFTSHYFRQIFGRHRQVRATRTRGRTRTIMSPAARLAAAYVPRALEWVPRIISPEGVAIAPAHIGAPPPPSCGGSIDGESASSTDDDDGVAVDAVRSRTPTISLAELNRAVLIDLQDDEEDGDNNVRDNVSVNRTEESDESSSTSYSSDESSSTSSLSSSDII